MATSQQLFEAIDNYLQNNASEQEKLLVNTWYHSFNDELVEVNTTDKELLFKIEAHLKNRLAGSTGINMSPVTVLLRSRFIIVSRIAAAAAILAFLSICIYFFTSKRSITTTIAKRYDIAPGGNKAILTLANGRQIILNNTKNGTIAIQGSSNISKKVNGLITYISSGNNLSSMINYNTLTTQRGGQYQVILPDGSKVWLNASSSLRYPAVFADNERKVELLRGEAYFEVEHNKAKPFKVVYSDQIIEDLGTQFDINTYKDEEYIKTTLLQGSIRLSNNGAAALIKPGQQALTQNNSNKIVINETNTENAVAWKDGKFRFDNASLNTVMNELQRWYDVDVKFEGNVPDVKFSGGTPMSSNLSEVLKVLELNGIHFRIEGRTIIVYP